MRSAAPVDVVVCHSEVNNRYGTGILIQRMFPRHREEVVSIRADSIWGGEQDFGLRELVIPPGLDRAGIYGWTLAHTGEFTVRHIYCIPFASEEITAALALRDAHRAPFCLYVMDDQNVAAYGIPDELMEEAVDKATLRLAISSDMRDAYETKYDRRFWIAPPTMAHHPPAVARDEARAGHGILVGNISTQEWLEALLQAARGSELEIDWYSNSPGGGYWLRRDSLEALGAAGVTLHDPLPEPQLAARLAAYEVALVPTMPQGGRYENFEIASLSFPSRLTFVVVCSDLPIVVLGEPASYVARFVEHYGLGVTSAYEAAALDRALARTRDESWRRGQMASVERMRRALESIDIAGWLRAAVAHGAPTDLAFEALTVEPRPFVPKYLDETPPLGPWLHHYDEVHAAFRRLAAAGFAPDFVVDAAASTGRWSYAVSRVFPHARFVLVGPCDDASLVTRLTGRFADRLESCEVVESGRGFDSPSSDLGLTGRGVLRLAAGELERFRELLSTSIDAVVVPVAVNLPVDRVLRELGFVVFDELGTTRDRETGTLLGKDVLFVRPR